MKIKDLTEAKQARGHISDAFTAYSTELNSQLLIATGAALESLVNGSDLVESAEAIPTRNPDEFRITLFVQGGRQRKYIFQMIQYDGLHYIIIGKGYRLGGNLSMRDSYADAGVKIVDSIETIFLRGN